jgi:hypothetical protein
MRLQEITQEAQGICRQRSEVACLWVRAVEELNRTSFQLSQRSPRQSLFLALAARTYSRDLLGGDHFDSLYARYLMSLHLTGELWPEMRGLLKSANAKQDTFLEAWLTTGNGWSFALSAYSSLRCNGVTKTEECALRSFIRDTLKAAVQRVDEDSDLQRFSRVPVDANFGQLLQAFRSATDEGVEQLFLTAGVGSREQAMEDMLGAVLFSQGDLYLFPTLHGLNTDRMGAIKSYLDSVENESVKVVPAAMSPSGDLCADFQQVSSVAREMDLAWAAKVPAFSCPQPMSVLSEALEKQGALHQVQLLQMRLSLINFYGANGSLPPDQIQFRMDQRAIREIVKAVHAIRSLPDSPVDRYENNDWTKFLMLNFYDTAEGDAL